MSSPSLTSLARFRSARWAAGFLLALSGSAAWAADEFRVETHVYVGDEPEPVARTVTLFERGAVYDFSQQSRQVVVFRGAAKERPGQFILVDTERKVRTEVTTDRIAALMKKVTNWAAQQEDQLLRFSAQPEFQVDFNEPSGALDLSSDVWTYRVATVPADQPESLLRYRVFTDWYARLNSMLHNTPPPGPRLQLNEELAKRGIIPVEINRTIANENAQVRAAHLFSWRLSREDRARLEEAQEQLASFEKISNERYMKR